MGGAGASGTERMGDTLGRGVASRTERVEDLSAVGRGTAGGVERGGDDLRVGGTEGTGRMGDASTTVTWEDLSAGSTTVVSRLSAQMIAKNACASITSVI